MTTTPAARLAVIASLLTPCPAANRRQGQRPEVGQAPGRCSTGTNPERR
jgi:hypothetical protein